jgi:hypothetical protein
MLCLTFFKNRVGSFFGGLSILSGSSVFARFLAQRAWAAGGETEAFVFVGSNLLLLALKKCKYLECPKPQEEHFRNAEIEGLAQVKNVLNAISTKIKECPKAMKSTFTLVRTGVVAAAVASRL